MSIRPSRSFVAFLIGMVLTISAVIPGVGQLALFPGRLLAWPFWPEGVHSVEGGAASGAALVAVLFVGSWMIWSLLAFFALRLGWKLRASES